MRWRVVHQTTRQILEAHVYRFTHAQAVVFTDEWGGYNHIVRVHRTVNHGKGEWARDDDRDGKREIHVNTCEGLWTEVRNFLRPFRGVHQKHLAGDVAICEFKINLKRVSPSFIAQLVRLHHL